MATNIIAQYLTLGGATVELTEKTDEITVACNGCPTGPQSFYFDPMCVGDRMASFVTLQASGWAQSHAEACRAMPRA